MSHIFKLIYFVKPYWRRSLAAFALLTAVVVLDLTLPRLIQKVIDDGITKQNMQVVISTSIIMLGIAIANTLFAIGNNITSIQVGEGVARDIREALFMRIQSFSYGNLDRLSTGQLIVRLSSDAAVYQRLVQVFLRIGTRAPFLMIGSMILMVNTDKQLSLAMLPILLVTSIIMVFFISRMGPLFRLVQVKLDQLNTVLQENISGVRVVKAFVRADHESQRFESANTDYTDNNIKVMQFMSALGPALGIFLNIGIVLVIWQGGLQAIQGNISLGKIMAFVNYLLTTMGPLMIMVMLSNVVAAAIASSERISQVLEMVPEVQDIPEAQPVPETNRWQLAFENVTFHYNGDCDSAVLEEVNLVAKPGQTVAILGATGAGKSSLVNLIPRFYDPSAGRITFNGIDIRQLKQNSLQSHIGVVPQESVLFSGSVADNIRYGKPDASLEKVIAAAKAAQAHEFILQLPDGYDTRIEQRGVNLSGGQKQRIAIARALLTQPAILILDDSTSSVDVETETKIQDSLQNLNHEQAGESTIMSSVVPPTIFVVAQRISTVLKADKIIVIDKGRVIAEGTHQELMQSSPVYQEIYASQLGPQPGFQLGNGKNGGSAILNSAEGIATYE
jgi:ATP-binding cassette subfamily B multidrug efflux pump